MVPAGNHAGPPSELGSKPSGQVPRVRRIGTHLVQRLADVGTTETDLAGDPDVCPLENLGAARYGGALDGRDDRLGGTGGLQQSVVDESGAARQRALHIPLVGLVLVAADTA